MAERRELKWWEQLEERFAQTRFGGWVAVNIANPIDRRLLKMSGGRLGMFIGQPVGLLGTTGARSGQPREDRKSTRLNSSHPSISYAVFCLKKKKKKRSQVRLQIKSQSERHKQESYDV